MMGNHEIHENTGSTTRAIRQLTIQTSTGPARMTDLPDFVTVRGGAYCFLPSRAVLRYLAEGPL